MCSLYIYIYMCVCVCVFVFVYIYIYIYNYFMHRRVKAFLYYKNKMRLKIICGNSGKQNGNLIKTA